MNPFRPTFGTSPPAMVGRDELVDEFAIALDDGPGAPGRATIYTGPRGSGKTVLLNAVEDVARRRGWIVISETAAGGLVERLETDHLPTILADIAPTSSTRLTGVDAPFGLGGASWEHDSGQAPSPSLRSLLGRAADAAAANGTGVLLTIDEIHSVEPADIREIATTILADIAHRMGVDKNYAGQYRRRLLASELVDAPSRGHVDFALPYLRDYVRGLDIELDDPDA